MLHHGYHLSEKRQSGTAGGEWRHSSLAQEGLMAVWQASRHGCPVSKVTELNLSSHCLQSPTLRLHRTFSLDGAEGMAPACRKARPLPADISISGSQSYRAQTWRPGQRNHQEQWLAAAVNSGIPSEDLVCLALPDTHSCCPSCGTHSAMGVLVT